MCWRQVSKLQKTVRIVLFYFTIYLFISYVISPESSYTFVPDDLRVGDKYVLIFLVTSMSKTTFTDAEGADVFQARRCGNCFITNNKGFLPMSEYDAILVHGPRTLLSKGSAFMDPEKRFLIETSKKCLNNKLRACDWEPKIMSLSSRESYDLCGLCDHLHKQRSQKSGQ